MQATIEARKTGLGSGLGRTVWFGWAAWLTVAPALQSAEPRSVPKRLDAPPLIVVTEETETDPEVRCAALLQATEPQATEPQATEPQLLPSPAAPADYTDGIDMRYTPIADLSINITPKVQEGNAELPTNFARDFFGRQPEIVYGAVAYRETFLVPASRPAAKFCHGPLYFEDVNLERHGRSWGMVQPAVSGLRFFGTIPTLPYQMAIHRPLGCYDWNYPYQAGRPAPRVWRRPPADVHAALVQTGVVVGLFLLLP